MNLLKIPLKARVRDKLSKLKDNEVYYIEEFSNGLSNSVEAVRSCIKRNFPNNYINFEKRAFVGTEKSIKNLLRRFNNENR